MLKNYQQRVVTDIETFFNDLDVARQKFAASPDLQAVLGSPINVAFSGKYDHFQDRPKTGADGLYPRVCIKMPTGGGKTLVAVEAIRSYQNLLAKKRTGLVVWITHRDQIYRQTIENLQNKSHPYRQLLDQSSGNRTLDWAENSFSFATAARLWFEAGTPEQKRDIFASLSRSNLTLKDKALSISLRNPLDLYAAIAMRYPNTTKAFEPRNDGSTKEEYLPFAVDIPSLR
jgi:hypothetical protein